MLYIVKVEDITESLALLGGEAQVREIQSKLLDWKCGGRVPANYRSERTFRQTVQRKIEDHCPEAEGFLERGRSKIFLRIRPGVYRLSSESENEISIPEEVRVPESYLEGATKKIAVNIYERNPKARAECLRHYGCSCLVCGMDFEQVYGLLGKNYIHVHHLRPLAEIKASYTVDPIKDLRPVCPNCHAMLHKRNPQLSIEALRAHLEHARQKFSKGSTR